MPRAITTAGEQPAIAPGFGKRLKSARIDAGFNTQPKLAKAMDVNLNTISRHESGRHLPTIEMLYAYARVLGVSVTYLQHDTTAAPAVLAYLASRHAKGLRADTRDRLLNIPWSQLFGTNEPDEFEVDGIAAVVDRALRRRGNGTRTE